MGVFVYHGLCMCGVVAKIENPREINSLKKKKKMFAIFEFVCISGLHSFVFVFVKRAQRLETSRIRGCCCRTDEFFGFVVTFGLIVF